VDHRVSSRVQELRRRLRPEPLTVRRRLGQIRVVDGGRDIHSRWTGLEMDSPPGPQHEDAKAEVRRRVGQEGRIVIGSLRAAGHHTCRKPVARTRRPDRFEYTGTWSRGCGKHHREAQGGSQGTWPLVELGHHRRLTVPHLSCQVLNRPETPGRPCGPDPGSMSKRQLLRPSRTAYARTAPAGRFASISRRAPDPIFGGAAAVSQ
jgi:hypothetical protein